MPVAPDIVVHARDGRPLVAVECRASQNWTPNEAAGIRRNLLAHGDANGKTYFLLALPTVFYLWNPDSEPDSSPSFTAPAHPILRDYLGKLADRKGAPRAEILELAVTSWLGDLAATIRTPLKGSDADQMLVTSGVYDQMKDGYLQKECTV